MDIKKSWQRALLTIDSSIQDAICNLNDSSLQIIMVVSKDGKLQGTITDGDIRRGLLRGLNLTSNIDSVIHRDALVVPPQLSRELAINLMKVNKIHQLPIVDEGHRVVGMHLCDELMPGNRSNLMVIMAGGLGRRLHPHTKHCPKPLLSVAGKPMIEHIIQRAILQGFNQFVLAIHYLGHMIEDYFGNGETLGIEIEYLREKSLLGTAGALSLLTSYPASPFIVTNGDVLTDIHYGELLDFHNRHQALATMAVRVHEWQHPFGVVQTKGIDLVGFEEKPVSRSYINAGVYALSSEALCALDTNIYCDMPSLFEKIKIKGERTIVYPMHEPWLDVGRPDDLAIAQLASTEELV